MDCKLCIFPSISYQIFSNYDEASTAQPIAAALKNKYFYSLGIILMTTSTAMRNAIQPLATDVSHFYPIDSVAYLNNLAVLKTQSLWTCSAFYPTIAPPTPVHTLLPLITTTAPTTTSSVETTVNPLLPPIAFCKQNVLFLIDQSQTMILNGYAVQLYDCDELFCVHFRLRLIMQRKQRVPFSS